MASEWPRATLGECVDQLAGFAFKSEHFREDGEGVRVLRGDNVAPGRVRWAGVKAYPDALIAPLARYKLRRDDVVVAMDRPWIDAGLKVARIGPDDVPAMLVQRVTRLRALDHMDTGYIWAVARTPQLSQYLRSAVTGTAVPHISGQQIAAFPLRVPSLPEQRAIASVLGALDDKIESNRRVVRSQLLVRQQLYRRTYEDQVVPRTPLGRIALVHKATAQPMASPDAIFEQFSIPAFDAGGDPEVCLGRTIASGKTPLPGSPVVLVSKLNPRTPRVWVPAPAGHGTAVCSPEFAVLRPATGVPHAWLEAVVRFDRGFYGELLSGVSGTTGSRQRVKPDDVLRATVPDADPAAMCEWAAFASPLLARDTVLDRERRTLTAIRDALLPKLVSGQIRVPPTRDEQEAVETVVAGLEGDGAANRSPSVVR